MDKVDRSGARIAPRLNGTHDRTALPDLQLAPVPYAVQRTASATRAHTTPTWYHGTALPCSLLAREVGGPSPRFHSSPPWPSRLPALAHRIPPLVTDGAHVHATRGSPTHSACGILDKAAPAGLAFSWASLMPQEVLAHNFAKAAEQLDDLVPVNTMSEGILAHGFCMQS